MSMDQRKSRWRRWLAGIFLLLASAGILAGEPQQGQPPPRPTEPRVFRPPDPLADLTPKQKRDLMKYRFERMKEHADELAELAKSLQEDLDKSNVNVLSLQVVEKAEKIEKLAKKIREEAKVGP